MPGSFDIAIRKRVLQVTISISEIECTKTARRHGRSSPVAYRDFSDGWSRAVQARLTRVGSLGALNKNRFLNLI